MKKLILLFASLATGLSLFAQGTAFTYQGRLNNGANLANGIYDLQFTIYDAGGGSNVIAGPLTNIATAVSDGLFLATLDFGSGVFTGPARWLEMAVRTNGGAAFSILAPRQQLTPTPYGIYSASAGSAVFANSAATATSAGSATTAVTAYAIGSVPSTNVAQLNVPNTTVQATGTVTIVNGFVVGVNLLSGGLGYTTVPAVSVSDVSGSNAVISATVSNGAVTSLAIQNAGNNYSTNAALIIALPPSNATQTFGTANNFTGINTMTNGGNVFAGTFNGTFGTLSGGTLTLTSDLYLPVTTAGAGIIYSGGNTLMHEYGTNNFFAGVGAGNLTLTGNNNVGTGPNALHALTTGFQNTADGFNALGANTAGNYNTAMGNLALNFNTTGSQNAACGNGALYDNTTGSYNTAFGTWALDYNTGGNQNTAVGNSALLNNQANNNTAVGYYALAGDTSGPQNTAIGSSALRNNTTGMNNTAAGFQALNLNTNGNYNVANGYQALYNNTTGSWNTASGARALISNTAGGNNTATGGDALHSNTTGADNTAIGANALYNNTTASQNTATGSGALQNNTAGIHNTASGYQALLSNTNGNFNVANGYQSLYSNLTGGNNTASGDWSLYSNTSGNNNTAIGHQALWANATGNNNTAFGEVSLHNVTNGVNNIALGYQAGYNLTNGNNNTYLGSPGVDGDNNFIRIGTPGTHTNTFIAGIFGATAASGVAVYVNSSGQLGTLTSSARFKEAIHEMDDASNALFALHPVTFRYKPEIDPQGIQQFGLVAEEVEMVAPDLVARDEQGRPYTVRYEAVNALLLNEFLKEHRKVQELEHQVRAMQATLQRLTEKESQRP